MSSHAITLHTPHTFPQQTQLPERGHHLSAPLLVLSIQTCDASTKKFPFCVVMDHLPDIVVSLMADVDTGASDTESLSTHGKRLLSGSVSARRRRLETSAQSRPLSSKPVKPPPEVVPLNSVEPERRAELLSEVAFKELMEARLQS